LIKKTLGITEEWISKKKHGKALFGSGFIVSDKAATAAAAATAVAKAAAAATAAAAAKNKDNIIVWELSKKEKEIIKSLG
jgi:hypothetical protein